MTYSLTHSLTHSFTYSFTHLLTHLLIGLYPCCVEKHITNNKLSAKEWNDACIVAAGSGKGGGKADTANAFIPIENDNADALFDRIMTAAKSYFNSKV